LIKRDITSDAKDTRGCSKVGSCLNKAGVRGPRNYGGATPLQEPNPEKIGEAGCAPIGTKGDSPRPVSDRSCSMLYRGNRGLSKRRGVEKGN